MPAMPAMLDDPSAPVLTRTSGDGPYLSPGGPLPVGIAPMQVTLRDRVTTATIIPFSAPNQVPRTLLAYLCDQLGREIEKGDTYPMVEPLALDAFGPYWFGVFGAIMLLGDIADGRALHQLARRGCDWDRECLGSFYIKPNYPGRSSHVCNGGFLVTDASRNRGVGRLMGESYLDWAPKLGYTYSVFNLVYETNVASCRIWDALGFKRIGRVKGCGDLKSHPGELIDAIIYGRDLGQDDDFVSEERFDKIRFYLKNGKYPNGADRAEKSRLRSAATHYKLTPATDNEPEKLWLKGKEVISDAQRQYEIARDVHLRAHGGINKTTAAIAESFHWVRIKETVSQVIRNCPECSEMNKSLSTVRANQSRTLSTSGTQQQYSPPLPSNVSSPPPVPHALFPAPTQTTRADSPGFQLQSEAQQQHAQPLSQPQPQLLQQQSTYRSYEHANYDIDLPLDPALIHHSQAQSNANANLYLASHLADRVPSPFLSASAANVDVDVDIDVDMDMSMHDATRLPPLLQEPGRGHTHPHAQNHSNGTGQLDNAQRHAQAHTGGPHRRTGGSRPSGARTEIRKRLERAASAKDGVVSLSSSSHSDDSSAHTTTNKAARTTMRLKYGAFWEGVL